MRTALYKPLLSGTKDEKIQLAGVMARSGDRSTLPQLQKLSNDTDADVAKEGLRAMRDLQARLDSYFAFFCFCWPTRTLKCRTLASWNALWSCRATASAR